MFIIHQKFCENLSKFRFLILTFIFQSQPPEQSGGVVTRRSSKVSQHSVSMDSGMRRMSIHEGVKIKLIWKLNFFCKLKKCK